MAISIKDVINAYKDEYGPPALEAPPAEIPVPDEELDPASSSGTDITSEIVHSGNFYVMVIGPDNSYTLMKLDGPGITDFDQSDSQEIDSDIDKFADLDDDEFAGAFDNWAGSFDMMMEAVFDPDSKSTPIHEVDGISCYYEYESPTFIFYRVINMGKWFIIDKTKEMLLGEFGNNELNLQLGKTFGWWMAFCKGDGVRMSKHLDNKPERDAEYMKTVSNHLDKLINNHYGEIFPDEE